MSIEGMSAKAKEFKDKGQTNREIGKEMNLAKATIVALKNLKVPPGTKLRTGKPIEVGDDA